MRTIRKTRIFIASLFKWVRNAIDIRDIFVFGGLAMLGYGLYLRWGEWLAFVVCGVLLILLGLGWLSRIQKEGSYGDR